MSDYRSVMYEQYRTVHDKDDANAARPDQTTRYRIYDYYFGRFLPDSRDARILELACGEGQFLRWIVERGYPNVTGIDISEEQVRKARSLVPDVVHGNVLGYLANEVRAGSFDTIFGIDILEHLRKDEIVAFLQGCHRALRSGGTLVLQTPNADGPFAMEAHSFDFTHETPLGPSSLASIFRAAGLEPLSFHEIAPPPFGLKATVRHVLWKGIRSMLSLYHFVERGHGGSGIFTRNLISVARKP